MFALKKLNYSLLSLSLILSAFSCTVPNKEGIVSTSSNNSEQVIKVSDKVGSSVKMNVSTLLKGFSLKDTKNGTTSSLSPYKIRIVMSTEPYETYNNPVNVNTSFAVSGPFPATVKFDNLQPNKNYFIACKAFSSNTEDPSTNITESGTYFSQEYIQVNSSGAVSIPLDTGTIGQIDMLVPLKNAEGARVDVINNISNGKMADFQDKDSLIEKIVSVDLVMPDVDVSDSGDGVIVWKERIGSGTQKIKLKPIIDYIPDGNSSDVRTLTDNLNKPSVSVNANNNGLICLDSKATNPEIYIYPISNINNIGTPNFFGSNYNNCDIQIKNSIPSDSGLIAYTDSAAGGVIKAKGFKSANNFSSVTYASDMSSSETTISSNTSNQNVSISRVTKDNNALVVWQSNNSGYGITARKVKINNSVTPPVINLPSPECDTYLIDFDTSYQLLKPSVSIDENGSGFVVWEKQSNIYYRKIYEFKAQGATKQVRNPITNTDSNPKVMINSKGNGLISWTEAQDMYGINIYNYEVFGNPFKIDDSTSSIQDNSSFDIDEKGHGYISWTDDRDAPGTKAIYGKRIIDFYPN